MIKISKSKKENYIKYVRYVLSFASFFEAYIYLYKMLMYSWHISKMILEIKKQTQKSLYKMKLLETI